MDDRLVNHYCSTMDQTTALTAAIDAVLADRLLLSHPFYQRWTAGTLTREELTAYAGQYRSVEATLPTALGAIIADLNGSAKVLVQANLDDELSNPAPHLDLFDQFAAALGADLVEPTPATAHLINTYATAAERSGAFGLGVLAAYEVQAAEVATSKADGLRTNYGVDDHGTAFWDVHASLEVEHGNWVVEALAHLDADDLAEALAGVEASAAAWWSFLDEREAAAAPLIAI